jgi:hypothetical protein
MTSSELLALLWAAATLRARPPARWLAAALTQLGERAAGLSGQVRDGALPGPGCGSGQLCEPVGW